MDVTAIDLVKALTVAMGRDEEQELDDYLVDSLVEATAALVAVLDEILKATNEDERVLL